VTTIKYRPDIDGLRAVAILAVLVNHAFPKLLQGGFSGVDVFFVISGYLISLILLRELQKGTFRFTDFYARRVRRLFPALLVMLLLCLLAGYLMLLPDEFKQLSRNTATSTVFIQNIILSKETGYFGTNADLIPLLHLWSLAVEEQFYIVLPLLLLLLWKYKLPITCVLLLIMAASFVWSLSTNQASSARNFYFTHIRAWELLAGALLAWSHVRGVLKTSPRNGVWFAMGGTVVLALSFTLLGEHHIFPGWRAIFPVLGSILLLAAGSENLIARHLFSTPPLIWIGLISYPLYLFHWPILSFARIVKGPELSSHFTLAALALSFLLASATYYLVEQRWRHARSPWTTRLLVSAFAITGLAGFAASKGWISPRSNTSELANVFAAIDERKWNLKLQGVRRERDHFEIGGDGPCTLFLGDSFCGQYLPRLAKVLGGETGSSRGAILLFKASTPPIPDVANSQGIQEGTKLTGRALEILEKQPRIDRIVIAACWPFYFEPAKKYEINAEGLHTETGKLAALSGLKAFLQDLVARGKKVYLILDPPWDFRLAPEGFLKRSFSGVEPTNPPLLSYEAFLDREKNSLRPLREALQTLCRESGVEVIDPCNDLVVDGFCVAADENGPIRSDMSHLRGSFVHNKVLYLDRLLLP
jgi:peptidoglycan/LPS O-acetylase OafA/YrhL